MLSRPPFFFLYPLALVGAVIGVALWLQADLALAYRWHADLMVGSFLLPAAAGFLLTNGHRFLHAGERPARTWEIAGVLILVVAQLVLFAINQWPAYRGAVVVLLAFLLVFALRRGLLRVILSVKVAPFLFGALVLGLFGAAGRGLASIGVMGEWLSPALFGQWYLHGMFWMFVAGFGSALFPTLTLSVPGSGLLRLWAAKSFMPPVSAALLALSFVIASPAVLPWALSLRAAALLFIALFGWNLLARSARRGVTTFMLKLSLATAVGAHLVLPFFPGAHQHFSHLGLVGGFGMAILVVIARMTLNWVRMLPLEQSSRMLAVGYLLVYAGLWTRATAHLIPGYTNHLRYAAGTLLLGLAIWCGRLLAAVVRARLDARGWGGDSFRCADPGSAK